MTPTEQTQPAAVAPGQARGAGLPRWLRRFGFGDLLVLPYVALLLAFGLGPTIYALVLSFYTNGDLSQGFAGWANYSTVANDFRFSSAVGHVLLFMLFWLPAMAIICTSIPLIMHATVDRFAGIVRLIYYMPGAVTGSLTVLIWIFMLDPELSPFSSILTLLGQKDIYHALALGHLPIVFTIMAIWGGAGGWITIVYFSLLTIPMEILEAATVDGCNGFQLAWHIKVPLVRKTLAFMLILCFAGGFQLFTEPQLISQAYQSEFGDPTWSLAQLGYTYAFSVGNFGLSAVVSVGLLAIGLCGGILVMIATGFNRMSER
jgi:multiple sugar transport system permease protein